MKRRAVVAGATGLVGRHLLARLLRDPAYAEICILARRPLEQADPRLMILISDFSNRAALSALAPALGADDVYCCLGTTLARAGSRPAFADVDERMVVDFAAAACTAGARQFIVVSAIGASERSLSFYSRVKGRMEKAVAALDFEAVHIMQPSLLLGARDEHRRGEALAQSFAPMLQSLARGPLRRYRPIGADEVAEAMLRVALRGQRGVHVHALPLGGDEQD